MDKNKIIIKYLNGEASEKEIAELFQWVKSSEKNELHFAEMKNSNAILSSKLSPDWQLADFDEINRKISSKKAVKRQSFRKIYQVAAAILFPVLLAVSAFLLYTNYNGLPDSVYTEVIAPSKSTSEVILSDGTQVWLSPESKLIYSQIFGKEIRKVQLAGEGYFEVAQDVQKPFIVETHALDVKVLGTSFNVEAYTEDKVVRTTLVRGSVAIESDKLQEPLTLTPGERLSYDLASNEINIEIVNTEIYELVKDGILIFKRNNLTEVCRKLERWFMIPIEYDGSGNQDLLFTAKFEDESIEQILTILNEMIPINYQIQKDKIVIIYKGE